MKMKDLPKPWRNSFSARAALCPPELRQAGQHELPRRHERIASAIGLGRLRDGVDHPSEKEHDRAHRHVERHQNLVNSRLANTVMLAQIPGPAAFIAAIDKRPLGAGT